MSRSTGTDLAPDAPTLSHRVEYTLVRAAVFLAGLFPLRCSLRFGSCLGWTAWSLLRIRRKVVLRNLSLAFPDMTLREMDRVACLSYRSSGRFMMEFARQARMNGEYIARHVTVDDPARLEELRGLGGAIVITGHFGSWELFGVTMKYLLGDLAFLVGRQSNGLVDGFINGLRSCHGIDLYNRRSAVRGVVTSLGRGGYVCWISDQDAGRSGMVVDFFGHPASTPRGAAAFAVKLGAPVVVGVLVRDGRGPDHRLVLSAPVRPRTDLPREEAEKDVTQKYTLEIEKMARLHPDQYWWSHRRWKSTGVYAGGSPAAVAPVREGKA
jgi:Kdo2-lipid IVA lauroyltransferase/acyltransferase